MKIISLLLAGFCCIASSNSRLIEKNTDRTLTTETKTGSSPPVRLTRDVSHEEDTLTGISEKEDHLHSNEFLHGYNKKLRNFAIPKSEDSQLLRLVRKSRDSSERVERAVKNVTSSSVPPATHVRPKAKPALVKKPIPKYNEMDYDDDFQMKINKSPVKVIDSGEHEDEDFNINDYDFDVNHDEFVGRGKPLEPRLKHKDTVTQGESAKHDPKPVVAPEIKIKSKVNIPTSHRGTSNKRERSAEINKKPGEKEDYYDEATTIKANEKARDLEDDFNEENEESKEYDSKVSTVRLVRSPWKMNNVADKLGEKASGLSKILSILPMFPQVPRKERDVRRVTVVNDTNTKQTFVWSNEQLKD